MKKNLFIINNEKCVNKNGNIYCQNLEIKLLASDLKKFFNLFFLLRSSKIKPVHSIDCEKISISSNIFTYIYKVFFSCFSKNSNYLIISITPYTFLSFMVLFIFRKKMFLYLRSDGKKEINLIFGKVLSYLYKLAEIVMCSDCEIITVNKDIIKNKDYTLVNPSSLNSDWFRDTNVPSLEQINILYVGRIKIEKGIYSLLKIFKEMIKEKKDLNLTLIGHGNKIEDFENSVKIIPPIDDHKNLIKKYDENNIIVLPSFTEGHPRVLIEALARKRPVIIFDEISHVKQNYIGVFICKREKKNFLQTIEKIIKNFKDIQKKMDKNVFPTREKFATQLKDIIKV